MRLWSIHPCLLDPRGLVALWREALLAQRVLRGLTKGYRHHPQLDRFRNSSNPVRAIANYLWSVADEAKGRGYAFDAAKIAMRRGPLRLSVTHGQLLHEFAHLKKKLRSRSRGHWNAVKRERRPKANPIFVVVAGPVEAWERVSNSTSGARRPRRRPGERAASG